MNFNIEKGLNNMIGVHHDGMNVIRPENHDDVQMMKEDYLKDYNMQAQFDVPVNNMVDDNLMTSVVHDRISDASTMIKFENTDDQADGCIKQYPGTVTLGQSADNRKAQSSEDSDTEKDKCAVINHTETCDMSNEYSSGVTMVTPKVENTIEEHIDSHQEFDVVNSDHERPSVINTDSSSDSVKAETSIERYTENEESPMMFIKHHRKTIEDCSEGTPRMYIKHHGSAIESDSEEHAMTYIKKRRKTIENESEETTLTYIKQHRKTMEDGYEETPMISMYLNHHRKTTEDIVLCKETQSEVPEMPEPDVHAPVDLSLHTSVTLEEEIMAPVTEVIPSILQENQTNFCSSLQLRASNDGMFSSNIPDKAYNLPSQVGLMPQLFGKIKFSKKPRVKRDIEKKIWIKKKDAKSDKVIKRGRKKKVPVTEGDTGISLSCQSKSLASNEEVDSEPNHKGDNSTMEEEFQEIDEMVKERLLKINADDSDDKTYSETEEDDNTEGSIHKCEHCSKTFHKKCRLRVHRKVHMTEKFQECNICGKRIKFSGSMLSHMKIHSNERPFKCEYCFKSFLRLDTLNTHVRSHTGEKLFYCDICGKGFGDKSHYRRHLKIHSGVKPYQCKVCLMTFTQNWSLKAHSLQHEELRPWICTICGKGYTQKAYLDGHTRSHTGERPFSCPTCGKSFSDSSCMRRHARSHLGERKFMCEHCGKSFARNWNLQVHMRIHFDDKRFECEICGKAFVQKINLDKHVLIHSKSGRGQMPDSLGILDSDME